MKRNLLILTLLLLLTYIVATLVIGEEKCGETKLLPLIPGFFLMLGSITMNLLKNATGNGVNLIMGIKVARLLLSILVVMVYVFLVKTNAMVFVITFGVFFLVYLGFETWMLLRWNKKKQ
ncbi:MAG: hypothetical protein J6W49_05065 [Paludibacteraceae bacterium]|nr:hypothetical protein [Paludibacteraceae bacterium]MBP5742792.1 hypothetical protein [Paludibacteraceae bacterium]